MKVSRHPADFPVFAFPEDEIIMSGLSGRTDCAGFENVSGVRDSRSGQLSDGFGGEFRGKTDPVGFLHFIPRMSEFRHEIAVIGKQDQPFAVFVQPSGGNQSDLFRLRDQIDCFFCRVTVIQGADVSAGFVQHDVKFLRRRSNGFSPVFHPVSGHDPHGAAVRCPSVDCDLSGNNQRFSPAAGTDPRCAQKFSQAE